MAIAYQSLQSNSSTDGDLVITKPVSLAVGDTLLAGILFNDDNSAGTGTAGTTTPSGWTRISRTSTGSPTHVVLDVFIKEADSADVAASDFTFVRATDDAVYHMIGHLLRITDFGIDAGNSANTSVAGVSSITLTGFTPLRANTLMVAFLANSSASTVLNTSIALTTNNPSWTERAETSVNDASRDSTLSVYTATRAETTATGDITATYASSVSDAHAYIIAMSSQVDGSINPTTYVNAYAFNPYNPTSEVDAIVTDPTTEIVNNNAPTQWTNESKPTTTWVNEH